MQKITLKPFQITAIEELKNFFFLKLKKDTKQIMKFKAPTGSGKTIMMAQFVRDVVNDPRLNEDICFLWASIGGGDEGDLAAQSRKKFMEYYDGSSEVLISSLDDINANKILEINEIMFFNWSKIKARNKEGRKLRRQNEWGITWDNMLAKTKEQNRKIILLIDEAHRETSSTLSTEEINESIAPQIEFHITATHKNEDAGFDAEIKKEDVIKEGLMREYIKSQIKEDFKNIKEDLNFHVLKLAVEKRKELAKIYSDLSINVNPLLMIQLPNDTNLEKDIEGKNLPKNEQILNKDLILADLLRLGIDKNKIAFWFSGEKKIGDVKDDLESIKNTQSDVEVLLFKVAPATGWDCPRAQVMVMYREIQSPSFNTQLLGRILRTSEGKHYENEKLNISYLYTTYNKTDIKKGEEDAIKRGYDNEQGNNQNKIFHTELKSGIDQIELETFTSQRLSYNDLGISFQETFIKTAQQFYKNKKELKNAGFAFEKADVNILTDAKIGLGIDGIDFVQDSGIWDTQKAYKKLCLDTLNNLESKHKYGNISRSWSKLKSALNVWFADYLEFENREEYYGYIVRDLSKGSNSVLLPIIEKSLVDYKPIREKEEKNKAESKKLTSLKLFPKGKEDYALNYEIFESEKCVYKECYIRKDKILEKSTGEYAFIKFLEDNSKVVWWWKNGDSGAEYFSVMKEDGHLFFPDFFIKTKKYVYIIDTKSNFTLDSDKMKALNLWLKNYKSNKNIKNKIDFKVGFVKLKNGLWKISDDDLLKSSSWENFNLE
jgi:type III restriction enzyme